ncbi:MAG: FAD-dependent oxidoreductase, partial [Pseudomonadota bacterium]
MAEYSALAIMRNALSGNRHWKQVWRKPDPKPHYDVIIVGGGGHGLATAYYLAKEHGITNVAILEKGWLGGGNIGRNTTIIRSNYLLPGNTPFYEHAMKLWEGLSHDLNYNVMFSQRGVINLFHTPGQEDDHARRGNAMILQGVDARFVRPAELKKRMPALNTQGPSRLPILGGLEQPRAGTARHAAPVSAARIAPSHRV